MIHLVLVILVVIAVCLAVIRLFSLATAGFGVGTGCGIFTSFVALVFVTAVLLLARFTLARLH